MKRLLVTGTRHGWEDTRLLEAGLYSAYSSLVPSLAGGPVTLVHGAAPGIDTQAAQIWESKALPTEAHPADWDTHGRAAGPLRNQRMVDLGADLCVAFPAQKGESRGTWDCVRRARKAGITVIVMGKIEEPE